MLSCRLAFSTTAQFLKDLQLAKKKMSSLAGAIADDCRVWEGSLSQAEMIREEKAFIEIFGRNAS